MAIAPLSRPGVRLRASRSGIRPKCPRSLAASAAVLATALASLVIASPAAAKECGGGVQCACGDRMVASTTLTEDMTNCLGDGLEIRAGTLDCNGHQIAGPGHRKQVDGIWINRAAGVVVRNCVVRNFGNGILIDNSADSLVDHGEVFDNTVGVWVGRGSVRNEIRAVLAHDNRDEGVHLGAGSSESLLADGILIANRNENLYLIETSGNRVINNAFDRSTEASVHLKHASNNFFARNVLARRNIVVRGDSFGNLFQSNQLHNGRFSFLAIEEDDVGWTFPHDNTVKGGRVLKVGTCFMFIGAYRNSATDVLADRCRAMQEKEAGDLVPFENTVVLNYIGGAPGGGTGGDGGGTSATSSTTKGTIKFDDPGLGRDTLKVKGLLVTTAALDALHQDVTVRFGDAGGVTFEALIPAGTMRESGRSAKYEDREHTLIPGVDAIEIRRENTNTWSFRLLVTEDLSAADLAEMTLTWQIGAETFSLTDTWELTSEGWRVN
jgi:Periplasmic copper-binding protein (NosD)